jgi:decaprenylphospho-beta-D-erythro-pentofuranosid-2-ulose 2-reductase
MNEPQPILIVGATSAIARATAAEFARRGHALFLTARDAAELGRIAADLRLRYGQPVETEAFDLADTEGHASLLQRVEASVGPLYGVVLASGSLGNAERTREDEGETARLLHINFTAPALLLNRIARELENRAEGFIVGIGSVAGDRGRQSNYVYGSAKGGLALYLQGLRNRLNSCGVQVLTVKPGFVDTAMTYGLPGLFLVASPQSVGRNIATAVDKKRDTLYTPWFWRWIMRIIRSIPERVFKRLSL